MRFRPDDRILQILVGSNLYSGPQVVIRELAQNAYDAIEWRRSAGDGLGKNIAIRHSLRERWIEVEDDGIGMDLEDIENFFLTVGRDKLEGLEAGQSPGEQVAFFGIGVLSVFLIADRFEVATRKLNHEVGLRVIVSSLHEEAEINDYPKADVGTRIRVYVRSDSQFDISSIEETTRQYIRHVDNVELADVDEDTREPILESWNDDQLVAVHPATGITGVRNGRIGFFDAIHLNGQLLSNSFTLTNAGFLVELDASDLLPIPAVGFGGELDLHPSALNIVMSREAFQRDQAWMDLGNDLVDEFLDQAEKELSTGILASTGELVSDDVRKTILLWYWVSMSESRLERLQIQLRERILRSVPFQLSGGGQPTSIQTLLDRSSEERLYAHRVGQSQSQVVVTDDQGVPIRVQEEVSIDVLVERLRARRFPVVRAETFNVTSQTQRGVRNQAIDGFTILQHVLRDTSFEVLDIANARPEDLDLAAVERLPHLAGLFTANDVNLVFARIATTNRRVLSDPSGYRYLNIDNPMTRQLLEVVALAVSNPLRRRILDAYLSLEEYQFAQAREKLLQLLGTRDLEELANIEYALLSQEAVRSAVRELLQEMDDARERDGLNG